LLLLVIESRVLDRPVSLPTELSCPRLVQDTEDALIIPRSWVYWPFLFAAEPRRTYSVALLLMATAVM
jgi:hypothetical protein